MLTWRFSIRNLTANCKDTDNELTLCLTIEIFCWKYFPIAINCFLFSIKHIFVLHLRLKLLLNEKFSRTCQPECNICKVLLTKIAIIIKNAFIKHSFDSGMLFVIIDGKNYSSFTSIIQKSIQILHQQHIRPRGYEILQNHSMGSWWVYSNVIQYVIFAHSVVYS